MHETVISCSWESFVSTARMRGSMRPAFHVRDADVVEHDVVVLEQRQGPPAKARRRCRCPRRRTAPGRSGPTRRPGRRAPRPARPPPPRRARRSGGAACASFEQPSGLFEPGLVAVAVLLGGALDVGDPLAEPRRVGRGLPAASRDALTCSAVSRNQSICFCGSWGSPRTRPGSRSPPHLEEADAVGVAEVEVLRFDSTSAAMTGSSGGMPRFWASLAIQAASCSRGASSPG